MGGIVKIISEKKKEKYPMFVNTWDLLYSFTGNTIGGPAGMAGLVKHLPYKPEDQSSDPTFKKKKVCGHNNPPIIQRRR